MRPDEEANKSEIQRDERFRENVGRGVKTAAAIGTSAVAASIVPFLSEFVPVNLALKGIQKISPKIGDFLKKGQSAGLNVEGGLQYLRDQLNIGEQESKQTPKNDRNIIEQYSPELHSFLVEQMKSGKTPGQAAHEAAKVALKNSNVRNVIDRLKKDHKTPWYELVDTVYGQEGMKQQQQQNAPQSNPEPQTGKGQQALMDILSKINQKLGQ